MGNRLKFTPQLRKIAFARYGCSPHILFSLATKAVESMKIDRAPSAAMMASNLSTYRDEFRAGGVSSETYHRKLTMLVNHCRLHLTKKYGHHKVGTYDPYISAFLSRCRQRSIKN